MKISIFSGLVIALAFSNHSGAVAAQSPAAGFMVSPKQCTTLKQGDICYLNLQVSWQQASQQNYCLFANAQKLHCWHSVQQGQWQQDFAMQQDLVITLQTSDRQVLHSQTIRYAWMYKKKNSKEMRWRMF